MDIKKATFSGFQRFAECVDAVMEAEGITDRQRVGSSRTGRTGRTSRAPPLRSLRQSSGARQTRTTSLSRLLRGLPHLLRGA